MFNQNESIQVTRRGFVGAAAATAVLGLSAAVEEKPILRIGAMTDDHLHPDRPETHLRSKACFALFRKMNADIVVDTGDIADLSHVTELQLFRKMFDEAFAGTACVPFFCIANHDYNYVPHTKRNDPKNIENAWRALGMSGPNPTAVVKGYQFVNVFQNEPKPNAFAEAVEKAVAANTDNRPVFVVNHVPPMLTTTGTVHWSSQAIRDVLNKYPQVVALTGHIHTAINWAANIWQGEFTAVNLGAHAEYSNKIRGEAVVLDVFADRIDVRRYEAVTGREIGTDDRWSIPLPLDPKNGPYRPEVRAKACPIPVIPASATVTYVQSKTGETGSLAFSSSEPRGTTCRYRITLEARAADGSWKFLGLLNWRTPQVMDEPDSWTCSVSPAMLEAGCPHRATIVPINSHDVEGKGKTFLFDVPANPAQQALPAELTQVARYQQSFSGKGKDIIPDANGWFTKVGASMAVVLPKAFSQYMQSRTKPVTLVFDIASEQPGNPNTLSLARFPAGGGATDLRVGGRIYMLPGTCPTHRYVWTITKSKDANPEDEYCLVIREGGAFRGKINSIRAYVYGHSR